MTMTETVATPATETQIDQESLEEAQRQLGGVTRNEAINEGLRLVGEQRRERRARALERLQAKAEEGTLDFAAIEEVDRCNIWPTPVRWCESGGSRPTARGRSWETAG
jgi:hypothetical protein